MPCGPAPAAAGSGAAALTGGIDRRGLSALAGGHVCSDFCQGAVPALLPFLIAERGYSYAAAAALLLAATLGSSFVQPLFGLASDRLSLPWLMPLGVLLGGIGIALVGVAPSYGLTFAAVTLSGLGVAAFHPEAARFANYVSGARRGTGMSLFALGGNVGFALGPLVLTPIVLVFGLEGSLAAVLAPAVVALVLLRELPRLRGFRPALGAADTASVEGTDPDPDQWGPFARLGGVVALRSGVYFGLQAFVPIYFATQLGASEAAGNAALTLMLAAGAVGTYIGGRLVDRVGRRVILVGSMAVLGPLIAAFLLVGRGPATALLAAIGFVTISNFSTTVVMAQEYLPGRLGLASGVSLGLAIGVGGIAAAGLGLLADAAGVDATMWAIAALPVPALLLALTLPRTPVEVRLAGARAGQAEGAPV